MAGELGEEKLRNLFANLTTATMRGAGHMIHHERPAETAALLESFLSKPV
jgi:pimeloyl-ACP methyl ester carboxylesterase